MNVYAEINVEVVKNDFRYNLLIPVGAPYEDAFAVLEDMHKEIESMKERAAQHMQQMNNDQEAVTSPNMSEGDNKE